MFPGLAIVSSIDGRVKSEQKKDKYTEEGRARLAGVYSYLLSTLLPIVASSWLD